MSQWAQSNRVTARLAFSVFIFAFFSVGMLVLARSAGSAPKPQGGSHAHHGGSNHIDHYSKHPSGNNPYYACPPPTVRRASCLAIVEPGGSEPGAPTVEGGQSGIDG